MDDLPGNFGSCVSVLSSAKLRFYSDKMPGIGLFIVPLPAFLPPRVTKEAVFRSLIAEKRLGGTC